PHPPSSQTSMPACCRVCTSSNTSELFMAPSGTPLRSLACSGACAHPRASVTEQLGDRANTLPGDARSLFHREGVGRPLQFNGRNQPDRTGMHQRFQIKRLGIAGKRGGEPPKIRRLLCSRFVVPQRVGPSEIRSAERDPHRVDKELSAPLDRQFEVPALEKIRLIDDTQVSGQFSTLCRLLSSQ